LSEAVQGFSSLPCTEYELKSLHTLYDVHHKYLINKEFTISNLYQNIKHNNFSIVHIASHGQFSANLEDTFILTYDDKMSMDQLLSNFIGNYKTLPFPRRKHCKMLKK